MALIIKKEGVISIISKRTKTLIFTISFIAFILLIIIGITIFNNIRFSRLSPIISPISASGSHSMVIMVDGSLWTWGSNSRGQLGNGESTIGIQPTPPNPNPIHIMDDAIFVDSDANHSFVITSDGTLWGWGSNFAGSLGIGGEIIAPANGGWALSPPFRPLGWSRVLENPVVYPVRIKRNVVLVSSGRGHAWAIRGDGVLFGWGNRDSYLWIPVSGTSRITTRPTQATQNIVSFSTSDVHAMAIDEMGTLWGWGGNNVGQLNYDVAPISGPGRRSFREIEIMQNISAVSVGGYHTAAIMTDGSLWTWGSNSHGQLGNGKQTAGIYPTPPNPYPTWIMNDVAMVVAGTFYTMAITNDGNLFAWGDNTFGQLGDGTTENRHIPTFIMDDVVYVAAGDIHTLAIRSDGSLWAWGDNGHGQLGDGTTETRHVPVHIMDGVMLPSR